MTLPIIANPWGASDPSALLNAEPVFISSSFRTGSTWVWQKFRSAPTTLAYCEFCHEALASLSPRTANAFGPGTWASKHPPSAPYFLEFLPLLAEAGGVPEFSTDMSIPSFVPRDGIDGTLSVAEQVYFKRLIAHARERRKIPVLTCTRTLGRSRAIKKFFDCRMVFVHRNIFHQWASYSHQAIMGNNYFIETIEQTIEATRHDPFLSIVSDWFSSRTSSPESTELFLTFLALHLYAAAVAHDAADFTFDINAIAADAKLAEDMSDALSRIIHSPIDFSDVKIEFECVVLPEISRPVLVDTLHQFIKLMTSTLISEQGIKFALAAAEDTLAEWDRHDFFTRRLRSVNAGRVAEFEARLASATAEAMTCRRQMIEMGNSAQQAQVELTQQRDAYHYDLVETQQQLANLGDRHARLESEIRECSQIREELRARTDERNQLAIVLSESQQVAEACREEVAALQISAQQAHAEVIQERDTNHAALIKAQHDLAEINDKLALTDGCIQELEIIRAEFNSQSHKIDKLSANLDAERKSLHLLISEREQLIVDKAALEDDLKVLEKDKENSSAEIGKLRAQLSVAEADLRNERAKRRRWWPAPKK